MHDVANKAIMEITRVFINVFIIIIFIGFNFFFFAIMTDKMFNGLTIIISELTYNTKEGIHTFVVHPLCVFVSNKLFLIKKPGQFRQIP